MIEDETVGVVHHCICCKDVIGKTDDEECYFIKYTIVNKGLGPNYHVMYFGPFCNKHKPVDVGLVSWSHDIGEKLLNEMFNKPNNGIIDEV